jgi:hypothetical protein
LGRAGLPSLRTLENLDPEPGEVEDRQDAADSAASDAHHRVNLTTGDGSGDSGGSGFDEAGGSGDGCGLDRRASQWLASQHQSTGNGGDQQATMNGFHGHDKYSFRRNGAQI